MPINPTYNNRVRFKLLHPTHGQRIIKEPTNFRSIEPEYTIASSGSGMLIIITTSLIFVDDAADYLRLLFDLEGINAKVKLLVEQRHPHTDKWETYIQGDLDFSTYSREGNQVSIKIAGNSKLYETLKSLESNEVEIERLSTLEGRAIAPLNTILLPLTPRRIFLLSKLKNRSTEVFQTTGWNMAPLLDVEINSDQSRVLGVEKHSSGSLVFHPNDHGLQQLFYYRNDQIKTLKLSIDWKAKIKFFDTNSANQTVTLSIFVGLYDGVQANFQKWVDIATFNGNNTQNWQDFEYKTTNPISEPIGPEQCLALVVRTTPVQPAISQRDMQTLKCDLVIEEDSFVEATNTKAVLNHELGQRLTEIITDDPDAFYSETLGRTDLGYAEDGSNSLLAYAHGMWIRQFDKEPQDDEVQQINGED